MQPSARAAGVRCAIYTRKSTEEGLEQDFNSLDAQRESAEAYILSQRHERWTALPQRYDDGGFTGANIERPGLKELLADVDAGLIDCVVVYKVDRLSRSLLDFARIMEVFDRAGVSFVSVTQQFNSTSSMGRLTLNVLLSFAQFEREIIRDRTRDKMVAARRKGKWIGGFPPLGYDPDALTRKLVVNEEEARQVRSIFAMFLANESLAATLEEIERRGWKTKGWTTRKSKVRVGSHFDRPGLSRVLSSVIYIGEVNHAGQVYPGEQPAIVDRESWNRANELLQVQKRGSDRRERKRCSPLLEHRIVCAVCGNQMVHGYTTKGGRRYRYYLCQTARKRGAKTCPGQMVAAQRIEAAVMAKLSGLADPSSGKTLTEMLCPHPTGELLITRNQYSLLDDAIEQIRYDHRLEQASIRLRRDLTNSEEEIFITIRKDPSGKRYSPPPDLDSDLILPQIARRMALAIRFEKLLKEGVVRKYPELARNTGVSTTRISQILKLRHLAPAIQERLLFLKGDEKFVSESVLRRISQEIDWSQQMKTFDQLLGVRVVLP